LSWYFTSAFCNFSAARALWNDASKGSTATPAMYMAAFFSSERRDFNSVKLSFIFVPCR